MFCNARIFDLQQHRARIQHIVASIDRVIVRAFHVLRASCTHIVKWSQCFFHCSVVNGVQCEAIPARTDATPAMLHG